MEFQESSLAGFLGAVAAIAEAEVPTLRHRPSSKLHHAHAHFLCGDSHPRYRVTHASLQEFLPSVSRDVIPCDVKRHGRPQKSCQMRMSKRSQHSRPRCRTTAFSTSSLLTKFVKPRSHLDNEKRSDSDVDRFFERYGGRLFGGTGENVAPVAPMAPTFTPTLMLHCLLAALTSLPFGFDTGASSASLFNFVHVGGLPIDQSLGPLLQGWILSSAWVGNFVGTCGSFFVSNSRVLLIASGVLNGIGGLSVALAPNLPMLIAGRVLCGVGNGFVCVGLSMYLGEIAPAESRGGSISCLESAFISGAFAGAVVGRMWLNTDNGWRWIWGTCSPLGILAVVAVLQLPDTPRAIYLRSLAAARRGHVVIEGESGGTGSGQLVEGDFDRRRAAALEGARRDAERVMCQLRGLDAPDERLLAELDDMDEFYASTPGATPSASSSSDTREAQQRTGELSLIEALSSSVERKNLFKGALAMLSPAMTGHAAIMTYGTQMFASVGYEVSQAADLNVLLQAVKLVVTLPDFLWLDNVPRRALMIVGLGGVAASYLLTIVAMPLHQPGLAAFALLMSAAAYQASVGPLSWIMPPEVLSGEFRSRGSSVLGATYAAAGVMLVQLHPLLAHQGRMVVLSVYAASTLGAVALNQRYLPETRGLSLEAIERQAIREDREDVDRDSAELH